MSGLRLVATDLDGTLLHTDGTVTERTRRALTAVEDLGVTVVFVTGRPMRWMESLWAHVGEHGLAVCSNGGIVYDVRARAVRSTRPIPPEVGLQVAGLLREGVPGTTFALEKSHGFGKEPAFMERHPLPPEITVGPLEELFDDGVVKLLARHEELDPEAFWAACEELVGHLVTTTWSSTGALVEISAADVTKASTLALLCDELAVRADEVVAFGDMPNDLAMLEWAGTSYAMANAHPSVLELAGRQAPVQRAGRRGGGPRGALRAARARREHPGLVERRGRGLADDHAEHQHGRQRRDAEHHAPIGAAVVVPNAPTSGATTAPTPNCTQPSTAAAVPAASPCRVSASAGVFGIASPAERRPRARAGPARRRARPPPVSPVTSSVAEATSATTIAPASTVRTLNRRSSTGLSWAVMVSPAAFAPNTSPKVCGSSPKPSWSTNDAPET